MPPTMLAFVLCTARLPEGLQKPGLMDGVTQEGNRKMDAPERIYGWQSTQLSIAKYYGGIHYKGRYYAIDFSDNDVPLVRDDVLRRDAKAAKEWRDAERKRWKAAQDSLFD